MYRLRARASFSQSSVATPPVEQTREGEAMKCESCGIGGENSQIFQILVVNPATGASLYNLRVCRGCYGRVRGSLYPTPGGDAPDIPVYTPVVDEPPEATQRRMRGCDGD
jgi:hypothetical protein